MQVAHLFEPLRIKEVTFRNRIVVSPMCQYSAVDGMINDWHRVHLGSRAVGGAGLIITEAAAVSPEGRISPGDIGIWSDEQVPGLARVVEFMHAHGSATGIQLAHAGRKSSMAPPWEEQHVVAAKDGGWDTILAPSPIAFGEHFATPVQLTPDEMLRIRSDFRRAAQRALDADFDVIELHAAHGYLLHQFLSPLSNTRDDEYGGSFENRIRFVLEIVQDIRQVWPSSRPLFVRISATDWLEETDAHSEEGSLGWTVHETVRLSALLRDYDVDLIDVTSGGNYAQVTIPVGPGYQTGFSERVRREAAIPTAAVGMITSPEQADHVIRTGQADLVMIAREFLRDPYWPLKAAHELHREISWPVQYVRAAGGRRPARMPFPPTRL